MNFSIKYHLTFLLVLLLQFSVAMAERPVLGRGTPSKRLKADIDKILDIPELSEALVGVYAVNLDTGKVLYDMNGHKNLMPASCNKLVTTAAAFYYLGPDYRWQTRMYIKGDIVGKTLKGDVYLRGSGDPLIDNRFEKSFTSIFERFGEMLKEAGIEEIDGDVVGDSNAFDIEEPYGINWSVGYLEDNYAAPTSALAFNDNCIDVKVLPGEKVGDPARVTYAPVNSYVAEFHNDVTTGPAGSRTRIRYNREWAGMIYRISGNIAIDHKGTKDWPTVENGTLYAASVFRDTLESNGIDVAGQTRRALVAQDYDGDDFQYIGEHVSSAPLLEVIRKINKISHNHMAEQVFHTLGLEINGYGDYRNSRKAVDGFFRVCGINPDKITIVDGSGLSRLANIQPAQFVAILRYMYKHSPYFNEYYDSLPIAGDYGLTYRMTEPPAKGNVHGKTGYIGQVTSLTGYLTNADGDMVAYALLLNHYQAPRKTMRDTLDSICIRLVEHSRNRGVGRLR
jgi:serine-type D-Ala-D-Ala carboxypeptidase/endopeptidase (penicillin-binding protein 4)